MKLSDAQKFFLRKGFENIQNKGDLLDLLNEAKKFLYAESNVKKISDKSLSYYANTSIAHKERYKTFTINKKNGKQRQIASPTRNLKIILRCLNLIFQAVFEQEIKPYTTGFLPNKSIIENAEYHVGKKYVYNIDLSDFFHQIEIHRVKACLKLPPFNLKDEKEPLAFLIANLCCYPIREEKQNSAGTRITVSKAVLPQGAPTSPILSNIVCQKLDRRLNGLAKKFDCTYSRYADDITFSANRNVFQKDGIFITEMLRIIEDQNFRINPAKTRLQKSAWRQEVTGLVVNTKVNVNQRYTKKIRTIIHNWEKMGKEYAEKIFLQEYEKDRGYALHGKISMQNIIEGKLNFLKMVRGKDDGVYAKLRARFDKLAKEKSVNNRIKGIANKKQEEYSGNANKKDEKFIHNPKLLVELLKLFSTHNSLKYATHIWEKDRFLNGYERFITDIKYFWEKDFKELSTLNDKLSAKIWAFLLNDDPSKSRWGEYKIKTGWSDKDLAKYAIKGNNPFNYPLPDIFAQQNRIEIEKAERKKIVRFSDVIEIFKNEIEFRDSRSLNHVIKELTAKYLPHNDYMVSFGDLAFSFYTDVLWIKEGIEMIFYSFTQRKEFNQVHIEAKSDNDTNSINLSICQNGSYVSDKQPNDSKFWEINKGDFGTLRNHFKSLCNWSIEAKFKDGKYYRLHLLSDNFTDSKIEEIPFVEGFTHILQFYL